MKDFIEHIPLKIDQLDFLYILEILRFKNWDATIENQAAITVTVGR